jgi:Fe-S-cluster containining protein
MQRNSFLEDLWQQAHAAQVETQHRYPEILCRTGCNACCKNHGSPITFEVEWQAIETHLDAHPHKKAAVKQRYLALRKELQSRLALENPTLSQALFEVRCPFIAVNTAEEGLEENVQPGGEYCSIYEVRPTTCRVFGNTVLEQPVQSGEAIYACNPEKDRWETLLPMAVELPLRNTFFEALETTGAPQSLLHFLATFFDVPR